jgi:light-regulated signal transduction histidine kinase (bacteriophytochrome)
MNRPSMRHNLPYVLLLLLLPLLIFYIDSISYLYDYAFGAIFIIFILIISRIVKARGLYTYAAFLSGLIITAYFLSPPPVYALEADLAGRFVKVGILWIVTLLLDINRRRHDILETTNSRLSELIEIQERNKKELDNKQAQLENTNTELEAFAYSVSHDLRAPLRSIDGFSQALLEDYPAKLDDEGKDYLQRIRRATQKMGDLIDAILRLSRQTRKELQCEPIDLTKISTQIASRLRSEHPERSIDIHIDKGLVATGDRELLTTALENLLQNAWKYTTHQPHPTIEVGSSRHDDKTIYYVKDNGAGFDMKDASKLFMPFQRLHNEKDFPGIGIGLSTVKRIIQKHGGQIWAEASPGHGATFKFTL